LLHGKGTDGEAHIIMTGVEYQADHKRLFGLMDKGFKIVLHRQGEDDKTVEARNIPSNTKTPKIYKERKTQVREKTVIEDNNLDEMKYPLLKYVGIKKIMSSVSKAQKKLLLFLIDPINQNQQFTIDNLALSLGYANPNSLVNNNVILPLVKKNYIIKQDGKYKQNFSSLVGSQ
jgi:hypothetical protein